MTITPIYAALLALLFVLLSYRVITKRRGGKIALGAGGDKALERAMRVHANFAEYAPFAVVLIAMVEWRQAPAALVHGLGLALLIGRCAHGFGVSQEREDFRFRMAGMILTFAVLCVSAAALLYQAVR